MGYLILVDLVIGILYLYGQENISLYNCTAIQCSIAKSAPLARLLIIVDTVVQVLSSYISHFMGTLCILDHCINMIYMMMISQRSQSSITNLIVVDSYTALV